MSFIISPERDEPTIKIFESSEELQQETGQPISHGHFDMKTNTIFATAGSLAHEIGHYLDFKSGAFRMLSEIQDPIEKIEACLRNEIVAVLFAYKKCGDGGAHFLYESRFIEWLKFSRRAEAFGPLPEMELTELSLFEIQELTDWLVTSEHPWFGRLQHFFRSYLLDENHVLTYGQNFVKLTT